jgi:hypothetical protein
MEVKFITLNKGYQKRDKYQKKIEVIAKEVRLK